MIKNIVFDLGGVVFKIDSEKPEANINVSEYYGLDAVLGVDPPEESKFQ